jgi:hypothetical protein
MLRRLAKSHPRWSWKMAHEILLCEGWNINKKPTRRLWRDEARVISKPAEWSTPPIGPPRPWRTHAHRFQMAVDRTTPAGTLIVG